MIKDASGLAGFSVAGASILGRHNSALEAEADAAMKGMQLAAHLRQKKWIPREANRVADAAAKLAMVKVCSSDWTSRPPNSLRKILESDAMRPKRNSKRMGFPFIELFSSSSSGLLMSSTKKLVIFIFSLSVVLGHYPRIAEGRVKLPPGKTMPAVLVFGDSIMDTGNNNNLKSVVRCNFPPYGQNFPGEVPTGRFGNGKVPSDFIAQALGIKEFVPPYADTSLTPEELRTGVCFASGGTGYDPQTPQLVSVISLSEQLNQFKEYIGKLKANFGEQRTNYILANSLYLVVAGSDDIANTYFTIGIRKAEYDVPAYTDLMVNSATSFLQDLYALGGRRFGVFSAPPIGCVPSQRTLAGGIQRQCAEKYNDAAKLFNSKLSANMHSLNTQLPDSRMVYVDIYTPLLDLILHPTKYGFKVANKGCCGTGALEVAILCTKLSPTCENPKDHVFWDSYHPSEQAYSVLVPPLLEKYVNDFF
ncbi:GDSL esterase/lipase EXL3-like [Argentina anserina]|uniref:GDSL esterase/lipase EXL3-like n=1 Tax=Argentina anserina TaxID=57926 RepID=UPI0021769396|nr:GDSL esterase/lipase EXL3-like [Potentilla anserina]